MTQLIYIHTFVTSRRDCMKDNLNNMKDRTSEFKERAPEWRIEAVIHDGSWYDVPKWARVAKVKQDFLNDWIKANESKFNLIRSEKGASFRVGYDEVLDWYSKQTDISIYDKIIPKNYPPRLWAGKTEVEAFIDVPRRTTSTLTFTTSDDKLLEKCTRALRGAARVRYNKNEKYRAYGLSDEYMRQVLAKALTKKEYESLNIKKRKGMLHRELTDFPYEFTEAALTFYLPFSLHMLQSRMPTLKIYLPEEKDIESQVIAWIVDAMRKFDETQPVPFSGYLSNVLRFWPYDLPDEFLGKELADFQRKRQKAMTALSLEAKSDKLHSNKEIADEMGVDIKDYIRLESEHKTWLGERNATTLNWADSANEKSGSLVGHSAAATHDFKLAHAISVAAINATLKTANFKDGCLVINSLDRTLTDDCLPDLQNLTPEFKEEFGLELMKLGAL